MDCLCGNKAAFKMRYSASQKDWMCDQCGDFSTPYIPDIYFKGEESFSGRDMSTVTFSSRRAKMQYFKQNGYVEAGDSTRGGPLDLTYRAPKRDTKEETRRSFHEAKKRYGRP